MDPREDRTSTVRSRLQNIVLEEIRANTRAQTRGALTPITKRSLESVDFRNSRSMSMEKNSPQGRNDYLYLDVDTPPAYNVDRDVPPSLEDKKPGGSGVGDAVSVDLHTGQRGAGFPRGTYFFIQEKGTNKYLSTYWWSKTEGVQIQLWPRQSGKNEKRCQVCLVV